MEILGRSPQRRVVLSFRHVSMFNGKGPDLRSGLDIAISSASHVNTSKGLLHGRADVYPPGRLRTSVVWVMRPTTKSITENTFPAKDDASLSSLPGGYRVWLKWATLNSNQLGSRAPHTVPSL
jgi:hypothetical protein